MKINIPVTHNRKAWSDINAGQVVMHYYDGSTIGNPDENIYMKTTAGDGVDLRNGTNCRKEIMEERRRTYTVLDVELNVK